MGANTVDLIYLDPPFNSKRMYRAPMGSEVAGQEFKDTWSPKDVKRGWHSLLAASHPALYAMLEHVKQAHSVPMWSYLIYMSVRLVEMERILKPTGSIYLHCDPNASHYLKMLMDAIFGESRFLEDITWHRHKSRSDGNVWGTVTDTILMYGDPGFVITPEFAEGKPRKNEKDDERGKFATSSLTGPGTTKGESGKPWRGYDPTNIGRCWSVPKVGKGPYAEFVAKHIDGYADMEGIHERLDALWEHDFIYWPENGTPRLKMYSHASGKPKVNNLWVDISALTGKAKEITGWRTQKPVALLERIVRASSSPGDLVFDPFCGCATAMVAAERLGRQWVGCDLDEGAQEQTVKRIAEENPDAVVEFLDIREPKEPDDGRNLSDEQIMFGEQLGVCNLCRNPKTMWDFTVDHIKATGVGGQDVLANKQLLCNKCNSVKNQDNMKMAVRRIQGKAAEGKLQLGPDFHAFHRDNGWL